MPILETLATAVISTLCAVVIHLYRQNIVMAKAIDELRQEYGELLGSLRAVNNNCPQPKCPFKGQLLDESGAAPARRFCPATA